MNKNICATLIKAIEEIEGVNFNHNQELLLLPPTIDPYASDEEIGHLMKKLGMMTLV